MFDFLKKKDMGVPDIGKEEEAVPVEEPAADDASESSLEDAPEEVQEEVVIKPKYKTKIVKGKKVRVRVKDPESLPVSSTDNFEVERLRAKVDANNELIKSYSERISQLSQQIGEVRAISMNNEKDILNAFSKSAKAVDIVREVRPEQLRIDYQKSNMRVDELGEKIEMNKQFLDTIMNEIKDLRNKAGIFVGTDALLKLNEDVKKDLIEIQKVSSRVRMNADKSEEIFIELKRGLAEFQKTNALTANLDSAYSGLKKEVEHLKVDYGSIIKQQDLEDFKKVLNNRIIAVESSISETESLKREYEKLTQLVETLASISRKNKDDIGDISVILGSEKMAKVVEYEKQFESILEVMDVLASQVNDLKKKLQMPHEKNFVRPSKKIHHPSKSAEHTLKLRKISSKESKEQTKDMHKIQKLVKHMKHNRIKYKLKHKPKEKIKKNNSKDIKK